MSTEETSPELTRAVLGTREHARIIASVIRDAVVSDTKTVMMDNDVIGTILEREFQYILDRIPMETRLMNEATLKVLRGFSPHADYIALSPTGELVLVRRGAVLGALSVARAIKDQTEDLYQLRTAEWERRRTKGKGT